MITRATVYAVLFVECRLVRLAALAIPVVVFAPLLRAAPQTFFPPDNPWNQQITSGPVAANSTGIINNIIAIAGSNGRIQPDFAEDDRTPATSLYGIPYNAVHGNSIPHVSVVLGAYADESDAVPAPIPANAVLEGDTETGPTIGLAARNDSHLLIWDQDTNTLYEFVSCSRPSENTDGHWHADGEAVWNASADSFRPLDFASADFAGLPILPGLLRPDEGLPIAQGGQGVIHHAIRFTLVPSAILSSFVYPASHIGTPGHTSAATQAPNGARFRLKASVDISGLDPQSKIIAQAMKDYGLILAGNGSSFYISGASYSVDASNTFTLTWSSADLDDTNHGLKSLHFGDFEVVDLTPVVASLSPSTAAAGATITITGQNFSGAAGHLQVMFGSTPSANVTFIDDSHLTALVPAGSGSVDVRVQSGTTIPANPRDVNSTIFGYGLSAIVPGDTFTYGTATGVCCRGSTCSILVQAACTVASGAAGATFNPGAACNTLAASTPCCYADYNKTGGITVQDIFAFLSDWFASSPYAIPGGNGAPTPPTVGDIFNFLGAWFAGC